jgi:hypothetical protein
MTPSASDVEILRALKETFSSRGRPEHFTNYLHCEECAEHDQLLISKDLDSLQINDVGNPGWDPICFISAEGFAYYLPALARLTLDEATDEFGWYGAQFFSHLIMDGPANIQVLACSAEQRKAVAAFVQHLIVTRAAQIDRDLLADDALRAFQIWNEDEAA